MEIREAQELMRRIYYERDLDRGIMRTILRTFQELSELSSAVMKNESREEIASELGDLFAWVCSIANLLDLDLTDALRKKYDGVCSRCREVPCVCSDSP